MDNRSIGKYEIIATLGRGSMGVVYRAKDPEIDRVVAIKTLKTVYLGDDAVGNEALQRFKQESRSAGKLHHPNIVTIFEAGKTDDGSPFIVMEFIEGQSLGNMLAEKGSIPPVEAFHYLSQIASAIDYAHSKNVIHRDIKPNNIIVDAFYRPYLLDFGVAKISDTSLTPAGTVVGTPSYMSPEQIRGETLDGRTDVFALAVLTYEVLVGKRPFPGNDFTTVVGNILHKDPLSFAELAVDLPAELENVFAKGLAKERDKRYAHALEFIVAAADTLSIVVDGTGVPGGYSPSLETSVKPKKSGQSVSISSVETAISAPAAPAKNLDSSSKPVVSVFEPNRSKRDKPSYFGPLAVGIFLGLIGVLVIRPDLLQTFKTTIYDVLDSQGFSSSTDENSAAIEKKQEVKSFASDSKQNTKPNKIDISPEEKKVNALQIITPQEPVEAIVPGIADLVKREPSTLSVSELTTVLSLDNPQENQLRLSIIEAGKRSSSSLTAPLVSLINHPSYAIRVEVLKVLSRPPYISAAETYPVLLKSLSDSEFIVRGFAVKVLAASAHPDTRARLEERLSIEQNDVVRKIITEALSKVAPGGA